MSYEGTSVDFKTGIETPTVMTPEQIAAAKAGEAWEAQVRAEQAAQAVKDKLAAIDIASIRSLREYIAAKSDAPKELKDKEAEAAKERVKMK